MTEECICVIEGQYEGCPVHDTKKEALTSNERCKHGVWLGDLCYRCENDKVPDEATKPLYVEIERLRAGLVQLRDACIESNDLHYAAIATQALSSDSSAPTSIPSNLRTFLGKVADLGCSTVDSSGKCIACEAADFLRGPLPDETKKDDARDAERYRYLRERQAWDRLAARKIVITTEGGREPYRTLREAELDREIDECIGVPPAQETPREPGPMCSVCDHIEEMHKSMGASHPFTPKASENPLDDAGLPVCVNNPSLHSWSVRGRLGNPLPEQLCENGCGLMWKNRDSDQNGPANPAK